jgi:hypothetical protein
MIFSTLNAGNTSQRRFGKEGDLLRLLKVLWLSFPQANLSEIICTPRVNVSILRGQLGTHCEDMILTEGHLLHMNLMSDKVVEQGGSLGFTNRARGVCLTYNKELPVASDQADGFLGGLDVDHLAPDIIQAHHLLLVVASPDVEGLHLSHPPGREYGFFQIS